MATEASNAGKPKDNAPPLWRVWAIAARPHTMTASISPCLLGHFLTKVYLVREVAANGDDAPQQPFWLSLSFISWRWALFCCMIQLGTNLHNDYADFVRGADTDDRVGQARATQRGWLSPQTTATASVVCLSVASAVGIQFLVDMRGASVHDDNENITNNIDLLFVFVIASSVFNAVAYTGGPFPLGYIGLSNVSIAYSGLGDVFAFLYFGLVATLSIPYIYVKTTVAPAAMQSLLLQTYGIPLLMESMPISLLVTAILVVNNLRDRHTDVRANKLTLAVRFGGTFCRIEYTLEVVLSYILHLWNKRPFQPISIWSLLPFATLPIAIRNVRAIWTLEGSSLNSYVGMTAQLQLLFCCLQCLSLVHGEKAN